MIEITIAYILMAVTFIGLILGSIFDIKYREVPDWLSFSLIFAAIGLRLLYSTITFHWIFLLEGVLGFAFFFLIACAMFYTGQWGGGDAKFLMGLGALVGLQFEPSNLTASLLNSFAISLLINLFLTGAVFGLIWAIVLAIKNRKRFADEFNKTRKKIHILEKISWGFLLLLLLIGLIVNGSLLKLALILAGLIPVLVLYLYLLAKSVETSCMLIYARPEQLTEGDWLVRPVRSKGKIIVNTSAVGLEKNDINKLLKLKKKVLIKNGIPFLPSFLIAYIITPMLGNWFYLLF